MSRPPKSAFESFNEIATIRIELVDTFDELPITYTLARIANQRNAAKVRLVKNSRAPSPG